MEELGGGLCIARHPDEDSFPPLGHAWFVRGDQGFAAQEIADVGGQFEALLFHCGECQWHIRFDREGGLG